MKKIYKVTVSEVYSGYVILEEFFDSMSKAKAYKDKLADMESYQFESITVSERDVN